jgi:hypothetical protein
MKFVYQEGTIVAAFRSNSGKRVILTNPQSTGIFYAGTSAANFDQLYRVRGYAGVDLGHMELQCKDKNGCDHQLVRRQGDLIFDGESFQRTEMPPEFEYDPLPEALIP